MRGFLLGIFFVLNVLRTFSSDPIPSRPVPPRLVNDFSGVLSTSERAALEKQLVHFSNTTGTQIVVLVTDDLGGYSPSEYANMIGEKWGVGEKGKDNGIVILIKPKRTGEKGQAYISAGYGLESVITDLTAKQIVEREMIPWFKRGSYYKGIQSAVKILEDLSLQVYSQESYRKKSHRSSDFPVFVVLGALLMFFAIYFLALFLQARKYAMAYHVTLAEAWVIIMERYRMSSQRGHSRSGTGGMWYFGGGSSGGGSSSGGGFGGFGGGSFGGGGAGGSW